MEEFVTYKLPIQNDFFVEFVRWESTPMQWIYSMHLRDANNKIHVMKKSPNWNSYHCEKYSFKSFTHSLKDFLEEHADVDLNEVYL